MCKEKKTKRIKYNTPKKNDDAWWLIFNMDLNVNTQTPKLHFKNIMRTLIRTQ